VTSTDSGSARTPRVAVVGCGAIARGFHLPALVRHRKVAQKLILVDAQAERARSLASEFGIGRTATNHHEILNEVDAVIVTVPHHLHYRITMDCLAAKKHVLCEKPLAESPREVREMIDAAVQAGVTLSGNHVLRLYPVTRRIAEIIHNGQLGKVERIAFVWGEKFDWPATSRFYFGGAGTSPRGVLFDKGPHVVDLVCWWLGGKPDVVACKDDSFGGGEAVASVELAYEGCRIDIELSFLSRYSNTYSIVGEEGRIDVPIYEHRAYDFTPRGGSRRTVKLAAQVKSLDGYGHGLIDNFLAVARGAGKPIVPAASLLDSVEVIDECYARRRRFDMPWHDVALEALHV
jgi:predicted dehydrogenase